MIPLLRQQFAVALSRAAKHMTVPHTPVKKFSQHRSKHGSSHHLRKYSLRNQRRIARLREKKVLDKDVVALLKQEVREHHVTRAQLMHALKSTRSHHKRQLRRQKELHEIAKLIKETLHLASSLTTSDAVVQAIHRLEHLENIVQKKLA